MSLLRSRIGILVLGAVVLFAFWLVPLAWIDSGPTLCLFKMATGKDCPGCGMTRAIFHVLHGDLAGAWDYNWRWVAVLPILAFVAFRNIPGSFPLLWHPKIRWRRSSRSEECP